MAEVQTAAGHYVWCSAEGTPPIIMTMQQSSSQLASGVGMVYCQIKQTGNYTCTTRSEAGIEFKNFSVVLIGKER